MSAEGGAPAQPPRAAGSFDAEVLQRFERIVAGAAPADEGGAPGRGESTPPLGVGEVAVADMRREAVSTSPLRSTAFYAAPTAEEVVSFRDPAILPLSEDRIIHGTPLSNSGVLSAGGSWQNTPVARTSSTDGRNSPSGGSAMAALGSPPPEAASSISGRAGRTSSYGFGSVGAATRLDFNSSMQGQGFGRGHLVDPFLGNADAQALKPLAGPDAMVDIAGFFPTAFTLFCLVAFLVPIWTCVHLSHDENVRYWIGGRLLALTGWLPVVYIVSHVIHTMRGMPVKGAVIACICGSCLLLALAAQLTLREADVISADLTAQECDISSRKYALQEQWREAEAFFDNCASTWASSHGLSVQEAKATIRITDCPGYAAEAANRTRGDGWQYLQFLEGRYHCAGWCEEAQAMWTLGATRDPCSIAVALVMRSNVRWTAVQVVFYSVVVFALASVGLLSVLPAIKRSATSGAFPLRLM
eukprot:CAMPEP_0176051814 /NCGR_PEP_ID=MMETSP0120_2-20121206/25761_1 /TAXON_ID=160619 /ORGANISM="Kryptoperidinium foliaceum, Strain CCMP 1326" /LENGTH=471 /DNA_ID=CAMNT_0017385255 /DNA_START=56 /DNA_END=1471 /DNA_ORIENTATION=-